MARTLGGGLWVVTSIVLYCKIHLQRERFAFNYMFTYRVSSVMGAWGRCLLAAA